MELILGIDVAKAKLDLALCLPNGQIRSRIVANTGSGFAELKAWLKPYAGMDVHVCTEAT